MSQCIIDYVHHYFTNEHFFLFSLFPLYVEMFWFVEVEVLFFKEKPEIFFALLFKLPVWAVL